MWKKRIMHFDDDVPPKNSDARQEYFLKKAACIATRSTMTHRHGCIIVNKTGEVISEGYNHVYLHMYHKFSMHAEVACLSKMKRSKDLTDCTMYVVRIGTDNMGKPLKYSRPCQDCSRAIIKSGLKKIYYSTSEEFYCKLEHLKLGKD